MATTDVDDLAPKQWELRAAWRAFSKSRDAGGRRNPAQQMVDAGWSLVMESDDFTVKDVAARAHVALQTFYKHFDSKDEFLLAMMEDSITSGTAQFLELAQRETDPREQLRVLIAGAIGTDSQPERARGLRWSARERHRLSSRFPHEVDAVHEPYRAAILATINAACEAGLADVDDPALTANVIQHTVQGMTQLVASGGNTVPPEEIVNCVVDLCWYGVAGRAKDA